jgi:hypothetical protein
MFGWFRAGDLEALNANTDVRALVKHQKAHAAVTATGKGMEHCCCRVVAALTSPQTSHPLVAAH